MPNELSVQEVMHQKQVDRETAISILNGKTLLDARGQLAATSKTPLPKKEDTEKADISNEPQKHASITVHDSNNQEVKVTIEDYTSEPIT